MDKILPQHLIFLILGVSIVSMKTYPRVFIQDGLRDSWIAVIISSILILMFILFIMSVWKQSGEKDMVSFYRMALGKKLGDFFILLFVITLFITLMECVSIEADAMHQNMLIEVPKWFFALFFVVPSIYVVSKSVIPIIIITIIGIVLVMLSGINLGILTAQNKDMQMLFPIFEDGITRGFIRSILGSLGLYGGVSIVLPYLSMVKIKDNKLYRYILIAIGIVIQMQIVSITGVLSTFELERTLSMNYPKLLQTQLVTFFQFFDYGELYVMLQMLGGWLLKYIISFYGILIILRSYFTLSKKHTNYIIWAISILVYGGAWLASSDMFVLFKLLNIYQYISLVNFVLIPFVIFAIGKIKMKKGQPAGNN